jgi:hypothetical protein
LQARRSARRGRGSRRGRRRGRRRCRRRRTPRSPGRGARGWGGRWRSSRRRRRRMWRWRRRRRRTHRCRGRWRRRFRRGGRRRRRRLPNLGLRRRRRRGPWWRSGTRGRARMRCGCGRRALWRSLGLALWWPFGPSLGTDFALRLRNDDRPGLRLRRRARELHRRQGGRGKQRDTKVCHDDLGPRKSFGIKRFSQPNGFGVTINSQPLGRNVAAAKRSGSFILPAQGVTRALVHDAFRGRFQIVVPHCPLRHIGMPDSHRLRRSVGRRIGRRGPVGAARWNLVRYLARQFIRPRRRPGFAHRRGNLRPRIARRRLSWRLGWLAWRCRWNFGRLDRHCVATFINPVPAAITAPMCRCSLRADFRRAVVASVNFSCAAAACCCGSCRPPCNRARACRRRNLPAIRPSTDVRSPLRVARATVGHP